VIELIANQLYEQSARVICTDTSGTETDSATYPENVISGRRDLYWAQTGTADRRIAYINMQGTLAINRLVVGLASRQAGNTFKVLSWPSSYPTGETAHVNDASFAGPFVGPLSQDYVYEFSPAISGKYAVGVQLDGSNQKAVGKLYGGTAISLSGLESASYSPTYETRVLGRQNYLVDHVGRFTFSGVSRDTIDLLERLYRVVREPVFFWDSEGTRIPFSLWHGIITNLVVGVAFDNLHVVQIETMRLRHYS
jgi:hypothetical protein